MSDVQRIAEHVSALVSGWNEHIEYAVRVSVHLNGCNAQNVHSYCMCPERVEARAKMMHHPALLAQLQHAAAMPVGTGLNGTATNKPESRPPGNMAPLHLIDTIGEEARYHYCEMWYAVKGYDASIGGSRKTVEVLHNLVVLCEQAHEHPMLVHEAASTARSWVGKSKVMLGYQKPHVLLASTVCGHCGGALAVASDASTDVRCIGTLDSVSCGTIYRRVDWVELLSQTVDTEDAVTYILGDGASDRARQAARRRIYNWSVEGVLTRHGGTAKGCARWDLHEIAKLVDKVVV